MISFTISMFCMLTFESWCSLLAFNIYIIRFETLVHLGVFIFWRLHLLCRNPTLGEVGGWNSPSQSWGFGVLRDSRMFRVRQQGPKHLTLRCSWCHWKGLEAYISKMASHWSFEHRQPKLWAKEGSGVKLAIWLSTTKSRESTSSRPPNWECNTALERSRRGI
jgi:hypothetical protein